MIAAIALAAAAPAPASVVYSFVGAIGPQGGETFTYVSPTFLTGLTTLQPEDLENCTGFAVCDAVMLRPITDGVEIRFSEFTFSFTYVFPGAALDRYGFWRTGPESPSGVLSIFEQDRPPPPPPLPGIPEPGTWALMIAGFGLTGAALRRRRVTPA